MFVESVAYIFRIEMEDGAAVLQKRRYTGCYMTEDRYLRDAPDTYKLMPVFKMPRQ